jgi:AcrR family transcriptional regulator
VRLTTLTAKRIVSVHFHYFAIAKEQHLPRPQKSEERRRELLPVLAAAFSDLGYRRATTAELAERCQVQENILYRLWPDKKAIFLAALDYLFLRRMEKWQTEIEKASSNESSVIRLVELTSKDLGEHGLYRVIFTALNETEDVDIKSALQRLYRRYHERLVLELGKYRELSGIATATEHADLAWTLIGMVSFMNIVLDLDLMDKKERKRFFSAMTLKLISGS